MSRPVIDNSSGKRFRIVVLALAAVTFCLYLPVTRYEFVNYDDPDYVTANIVVQKGMTAEGLKWAFTRLHGERTYWHPLTWLSHMLDCQLFGVKPGAHHVVNVLFHVMNSVLLLWVLSQMTGAFWRSAVVAAIFALHPLQVETVAWVTERKNLLSTLFWLLTMAAYVKYVRTKKPFSYIVCLLLFASGLMSKPTLVTLPFILLLLDAWPLDRYPRAKPWREQARSAIKLAAEKVPFFILSLVSSWITFMAHEQIGMKQEIHGVPLVYRFQNAVVCYAQYLKKIFFPFDLAIVYPHPGVWPAAKVYTAAVVLAAITVIVALQWNKRRYLGVGWFWFLGVLVPAIGIVQVGYQAMADRFAYVPMVGVLIMLSWAATEILSAARAKRITIIAFASATVIYLVIGTALQLPYWKDSEALFTRSLQVTKRNYVAHYDLALALLDKERLDEAEYHAREASRIQPKQYEPLVLLGLINESQKNFPAAISNLDRALALNPSNTTVRASRAKALLKSGRLADAKGEFLTLTQVDPNNADHHAYLGEIFTAEKNPGAAIEQYRQGLTMKPDWAAGLNNLAWLLATSPEAKYRNGTEAVQLAERACELTRNNEPMYVGTLAAAYAEAGRFADAVATAKRAEALANEKGLPELAQRNGELTELYEAGKPFHENP
jgi:protein O-mannosyl-transferase